tara:strand:- start:109 stop:807 length:699 start_codon:yes stop_codon:yes gene_type:complete
MGMLEELYLPDTKRLNVMICGQPGSGKSFYLEQTLREFLKQNKSKLLRVIYISPKHETILGLEPTYPENVEKHLKKERVAVIFPDPEYAAEDVDFVINKVFEIGEANEGFKAIVIVDDSQVFLSSRKDASAAFRRLTLTGRSRGIRGIFVAHAMILNKALEGSIQHVLNFTLPQPMFFKDAQRRFGFDPSPHQEYLRNTQYGYVWYEVTTDTVREMPPIDPPRARKKSQANQ